MACFVLQVGHVDRRLGGRIGSALLDPPHHPDHLAHTRSCFAPSSRPRVVDAHPPAAGIAALPIAACRLRIDDDHRPRLGVVALGEDPVLDQAGAAGAEEAAHDPASRPPGGRDGQQQALHRKLLHQPPVPGPRLKRRAISAPRRTDLARSSAATLTERPEATPAGWWGYAPSLTCAAMCASGRWLAGFEPAAWPPITTSSRPELGLRGAVPSPQRLPAPAGRHGTQLPTRGLWPSAGRRARCCDPGA